MKTALPIPSVRTQRKVRIGRVVSTKMQKTIVVKILRQLRHPDYGRVIRRSTKLYARAEANQCQVGDLVKLAETRPLSRLVRWRLLEVLERASAPKVEVKDE